MIKVTLNKKNDELKCPILLASLLICVPLAFGFFFGPHDFFSIFSYILLFEFPKYKNIYYFWSLLKFFSFTVYQYIL